MTDGIVGREYDLEVFRAKLIMSLSSDVPLVENLKAIMAPTLNKVCTYARAKVGVHVFFNPELDEIHTLVVGQAKSTRKALDRELHRRQKIDAFLPDPDLPEIDRINSKELGIDRSTFSDRLSPDKDVRTEPAGGDILELLNKLRKVRPEEFPPQPVSASERVLVVPLGFGCYRRLGCMILWRPGGMPDLEEIGPVFEEFLVSLRKQTEQFIVRVFSNFYQMATHTYLPSYHPVGPKSVAILCAEIRNFDLFCEAVRPLGEEGKECVRYLVNRFSRLVTEEVEREPYRARIDQTWGNGLLAVFGEYLGASGVSPVGPCRSALEVAARFVERFKDDVLKPLQDRHVLQHLPGIQSHYMEILPAAAVDYGEVVFDYVGSEKHRTYMGVSDRVQFVKELAGLAGRPRLSDSGVTEVLRVIMNLLPARASARPFQNAPILLSQTAYTWCREMLQDTQGSPTGAVHFPKVFRLAGKPTPYVVFEVSPENVRKSSGSG